MPISSYEYEYCSEPNPGFSRRRRVRWSTGPVSVSAARGVEESIVPRHHPATCARTRAPPIITRPNDSYNNAPGTFYRGRGRTQLENMFPVAVILSTFI